MTNEGQQDRGRRSTLRIALIAILVILILLLGGLGYFVFSLLEPVGAPTSEELPEGLQWVRSIYGYGPAEDQRFIAPDHVDIADDGTIWVSDTQMNSVMSFTPDGQPKSRIEMAAVLPNAYVAPKGLEMGPDGRLYVCANGAAKILVLSTRGELLQSWDIQDPLDITLSNDRAFVTSPAGVSVFALDGELAGTWGGRGKVLEQLDLPEGIEIGADGTVYVADTLNSRVKAFTTEGKLLWSTAAGVMGGGSVPMGTETSASAEASGTGMQLPAGICTDANGKLVLADPFGFDLVVIDPQKKGEIVGRYGEFGATDGFFAYPLGMAYDSQRDWFAVADTANARVQIVRIVGSGRSDLLPSARRAAAGPLWICCLPLALLLLIGAFAAISRRRTHSLVEDEKQADKEIE